MGGKSYVSSLNLQPQLEAAVAALSHHSGGGGGLNLWSASPWRPLFDVQIIRKWMTSCGLPLEGAAPYNNKKQRERESKERNSWEVEAYWSSTRFRWCANRSWRSSALYRVRHSAPIPPSYKCVCMLQCGVHFLTHDFARWHTWPLVFVHVWIQLHSKTKSLNASQESALSSCSLHIPSFDFYKSTPVQVSSTERIYKLAKVS